MLISREPEETSSWFLAFHMKRWEHWTEYLIHGRFSHVSAFAFADRASTWVLIDFTPKTAARVIVFPQREIPPWIMQWCDNACILKANVRQKSGFRMAFGFLHCVSAVRELVGAKTGALSPEGLWRGLIREGAEIVHAQPAETPARPSHRSPTATGGSPTTAG